MDTGMETSSTPSSEMVGILENIQASMQRIADRVTGIEDSQRQNPSTVSFLGTSTPYKEQSSKSWPDDTSVMEEMEKETEELNSNGVKLFPVSDSTMGLLKSSFCSALLNPSRWQIRDKFGAPNCPHSACPGLDKVMNSACEILEAVQSAVKLLGNFSACNRERRQIALSSLNPRIADMAEDDSIFTEVRQNLFGEGFYKKAKEHDDEMRVLNSVAASKTHTQSAPAKKPSGFKSHQPVFHRNSRNFRGGFKGRRRYQPYAGNSSFSHGSSKNSSDSAKWHPAPTSPSPAHEHQQDQKCLLMNHLKEIKFLPNMSQSPLMVCLKDLGFVDMAQSIAIQSPPPAGKIQLFIQNWKVLTSDRWVQDCVQGYAIDWIAQPHQEKPPHEIVFSGEEMNCLSLEVQKMVEKHAVTEV